MIDLDEARKHLASLGDEEWWTEYASGGMTYLHLDDNASCGQHIGFPDSDLEIADAIAYMRNCFGELLDNVQRLQRIAVCGHTSDVGLSVCLLEDGETWTCGLCGFEFHMSEDEP